MGDLKKYVQRDPFVVRAVRCPGAATCPYPRYQHAHGDWLLFDEEYSGYVDTLTDVQFRASWKLVAPVRKGKR